jgi:N-acetyl-anhydromuramyl-L-alanine amidase AmpD
MIEHVENKHGGNHNVPSLIVVHSMAEYLDVAGTTMHASAFLNHIGLSAHALIGPNGKVYRCRADDQGAWHAKGFNYNSLGIEFLVPGKHTYDGFIKRIREPYISTEQYEAGLEQITQWYDAHAIEDIKRHSDLDPRRKLDPGEGFPWLQLLSDIERFKTATDGGAPSGPTLD